MTHHQVFCGTCLTCPNEDNPPTVEYVQNTTEVQITIPKDWTCEVKLMRDSQGFYVFYVCPNCKEQP